MREICTNLKGLVSVLALPLLSSVEEVRGVSRL